MEKFSQPADENGHVLLNGEAIPQYPHTRHGTRERDVTQPGKERTAAGAHETYQIELDY